MICHNNKCLYIDLLHFSTLYRSNHVSSFIRDLARHFMLLDTVSNALARCMAPAPTSGYLAKKHSISSKLVCVANVIDGINEGDAGRSGYICPLGTPNWSAPIPRLMVFLRDFPTWRLNNRGSLGRRRISRLWPLQ